ncbi:hypothetical protein [Segetibacter koreensis]|uniref:hypothetical protein n=1 Tax=Segetibacter koreensis TaxID=398037 RepID=UPI0003627829|nr:hypothetical protein [Segetibacter koreensis]
MKKIQKVSLAFIAATTFFIYACGPNDNKGSMDEKNSGGEGAVDSTKIPNFDSSHADSSHASLSSPELIPSTVAYKTKTAFL